jgi:hypothetical protein
MIRSQMNGTYHVNKGLETPHNTGGQTPKQAVEVLCLIMHHAMKTNGK